MKPKLKVILSSVLVITTAAASILFFRYIDKDDNPAPVEKILAPEPGEEMRYVNADAGLMMRKGPGIDQEKITLVPFGGIVKVIEVDKSSPQRIDGRFAEWFRVTWKTHAGWMFGGYLADPVIDFPEDVIIVKPFDVTGRSFKEYPDFRITDEFELSNTYIDFHEGNRIERIYNELGCVGEVDGDQLGIIRTTTLTGTWRVSDNRMEVQFTKETETKMEKEPVTTDTDDRDRYICARKGDLDILVDTNGKKYLSYNRR